MEKATAEKYVIASALTVFAVYVYRHFTEGTTTQNNGTAQMLGSGTPPNFGRFLTGWGFAFFVIALVTEAAPGLGGSFAILVGLTDFLVSAQQIEQDINTQLTQAPVATKAASTASGTTSGTTGNKSSKGASTPGTTAKAATAGASTGFASAAKGSGTIKGTSELNNTPTQQIP